MARKMFAEDNKEEEHLGFMEDFEPPHFEPYQCTMKDEGLMNFMVEETDPESYNPLNDPR